MENLGYDMIGAKARHYDYSGLVFSSDHLNPVVHAILMYKYRHLSLCSKCWTDEYDGRYSLHYSAVSLTAAPLVWTAVVPYSVPTVRVR